MRLRPCACLGALAEGAERLRCTRDPAGRSWSGGGAVAERDSLVPRVSTEACQDEAVLKIPTRPNNQHLNGETWGHPF
ncbi:hypothetical protein NDU88_005862 [Pleurodeles waltl]|uniref:Uncharacterized protein n=1 Tax=Pleurodeles waltl TaxID=8319 RepID=A0AAV7LNU3_PLEWA|nr:hypothetical protein NDU88_005862 [Pleurodeles waltl]